MLHTKFHSNRLNGSGEKDFKRFLPYIRVVATLVKQPGWFEHIFVSPNPEGYISNMITIG